jgi:hypothetical protein
VFGADVVVAQPERLAEGELQDLLGVGAVRDELGDFLGGRRERVGRGLADGVEGDPLGDERLGREALRFGQQAEDEVLGTALGVMAALWAAITTLRARGVYRLKPWSGLRSADSLGTNRFCAACRVTPMLLPMSVQEAPERRAWSTKWPIRWSATSPR